MSNLKYIAVLFIFITSAFAQTVQQSGTVTRNHIPVWISSGVIGDGGSSAGGPITSIGVTNNGGQGLCINSAATTPGSSWNALCLGASTTGPATISLQNFGSATPQAIQFTINGVTQGFFPVILANPTGTVGLTTVNGSATTAMRSDAGPQLAASVQSALTGTNNLPLFGTGIFGFTSRALAGTDLPSAFSVSQSGDTTTFSAPPPGFGGTWLTIYDFTTNYTATHSDGRFTANISRTTNGSGTNGPANGDFGAAITCAKNNYLTSTIDGECDALYLVTQQGAKGDTAVANVEAQKVFGSGSDTGSVLGVENSVRRLDTSGLISMDVHNIEGFGEGAGGPSNNTGYGAYIENQRQSSGMSATTTTPFAAYYGGAVDLSGTCVTANCPTFTNFAVGAATRSAGTTHQFFKVGWGLAETGDITVGSGSATGIDTTTATQSGGTRWTMKNISGDWRLINNSGTTSAIIQQSGQLNLGGALVATDLSITPGSAWTAFTSAPTCGTATFTVNSARSKTIGKTVTIVVDITIATIGTCSGNTLNFSLPTASAFSAGFSGRETNVTGFAPACAVVGASSTVACSRFDGSTTWAANNRIIVGGSYETP